MAQRWVPVADATAFALALRRAMDDQQTSSSQLASWLRLPGPEYIDNFTSGVEPPAAMVFRLEAALRLPPGTLSSHLGYYPLLKSGVMEPPGLLDCDGAARYLTTSVRHVRRLVSERRVSFIKVGGKIRFRRTDLDALIEGGVHKARRSI